MFHSELSRWLPECGSNSAYSRISWEYDEIKTSIVSCCLKAARQYYTRSSWYRALRKWSMVALPTSHSGFPVTSLIIRCRQIYRCNKLGHENKNRYQIRLIYDRLIIKCVRIKTIIKGSWVLCRIPEFASKCNSELVLCCLSLQFYFKIKK